MNTAYSVGFDTVIKGVQNGAAYTRLEWEQGHYIRLLPRCSVTVMDGEHQGKVIFLDRRICIFEPGFEHGRGWLPGQEDMLAVDWVGVPTAVYEKGDTDEQARLDPGSGLSRAEG